MEKILKSGKAKSIGVSNYPALLLKEMEAYAEVMPAFNEIEFHPRHATPDILQTAADMGIQLIAYGSLQSTFIENNPVIAEIAKKNGRTICQTVLRWTMQKGVATIPKSAIKAEIDENIRALEGEDLPQEDMERIDALNENYAYYWLAQATLNTIRK